MRPRDWQRGKQTVPLGCGFDFVNWGQQTRLWQPPGCTERRWQRGQLSQAEWRGLRERPGGLWRSREGETHQGHPEPAPRQTLTSGQSKSCPSAQGSWDAGCSTRGSWCPWAAVRRPQQKGVGWPPCGFFRKKGMSFCCCRSSNPEAPPSMGLHTGWVLNSELDLRPAEDGIPRRPLGCP